MFFTQAALRVRLEASARERGVERATLCEQRDAARGKVLALLEQLKESKKRVDVEQRGGVRAFEQARAECAAAVAQRGAAKLEATALHEQLLDADVRRSADFASLLGERDNARAQLAEARRDAARDSSALLAARRGGDAARARSSREGDPSLIFSPARVPSS